MATEGTAGQKMLVWGLAVIVPIAIAVLSGILGYYIYRIDQHTALDAHAPMAQRAASLEKDIAEIKFDQREIRTEQRQHTRQLDRIETIVKENGGIH